MNKLISITFILLFTISVNTLIAQTWQYKLSETNSLPRDIAIAAVDNDYLYHRANLFFKFDQLGTVTQVLPITTTGSFSTPTNIEGSNTGYVISSTPTRLKKIDFDGNTLWEFDAPSSLSSPQALQKRLPTFLSENGNYYFAAIDDLYVLDEIGGTIINQYSLGGSYACAAIRKDDDNFVILGENLNGGYEIIQMDNSGSVLSTINVNMTAYDMVVTIDGFFVVGTENGNMVVKFFERNGNELFSQDYGSGLFHAVIQKNSDFVISGSNGTDGKLLKVDIVGGIIWNKVFAGIIDGFSRTRVINDTQNDGFLLTSTTHILKTDSNGDIDTPEKDLYINGSAILDVNNIAALINADGSIFWDNNEAYFKTKDTDVNSIFAANFWIGGYDDALNLKLAAGTYNTSGNDYQPGFIGSDSENMNKVWKISKTEIKKLRGDFDENGVINGIIPNDIRTYPARNNPHAEGIEGQTIPIGGNDFLAFFDRNNDGTYNAFDGDYPIIKGDMELIWFMNDDKVHTQSQVDKIQMNMVCKLYGYECGGNDLVNNTVFQSYQIKNESVSAIDSVHAGLWLDGDLGCPTDDYIGSIPNKNSFYYYNEDVDDGFNGVCPGVDIYTGTVPVQSVTYLNQPLDYFTYYHRSDLSPNPGMADPSTGSEYFNFLIGTWRDGSPFTFGGNGYGGTSPTNHVFSGDPTVSGDWALSNLNLTGFDVRTIGSSKLFRIESQDVIDFEIAYSLHRNLSSYLPNSVDLGNNIDNIQSLYDTDALNWDVYLGEDKELTVGQNLTLIPNIEGNTGGGNYTYLWSTGERTPTINVTTPIIYSVTVTNTQTGCTKTDELNVKFATSTEQVTTEIDKINVFPNPVTDVITIDATGLNSENVQIEVIEVTGKVIKSQSFENQNLIQIEVSNLPTGVYFLKFTNAQFEKIGFKRIVITQ